MMNIDRLKDITTFIFDMDGLLINSEPFWQEIEKKVFLELDIVITERDLKDSMGLKNTEVVALMMNRYKINGIPTQVLCDKIEQGVVEKIVTEGKLMKGSIDMLTYCRERGLNISLATSSSFKIIHAVLDALQIRQFFREINSAYDEQYGKPHPAVFLKAADRLGAMPHQCLVLEDSVNGVIAAKAAKMFTVAIPDASDYQNPKFSIADQKFLSLVDCHQHLIQLNL
jgi:HAD superfamily hydrolase (TIGR01509 family)